MNRIRKFGLVGRSVSLEVGFEVSEAQARPGIAFTSVNLVKM